MRDLRMCERKANVTIQWLMLAVLALSLAVCGCKRDPQQIVLGDQPTGPPTKALWQPAAADFTIPANAAPAPRVDGKRAMQYVKEVVAFGSRPIGSPAHQKLEAYIHAQAER